MALSYDELRAVRAAGKPVDDYRQKVLRAARRGNVYPYELTSMLAGPNGSFAEYDLDGNGTLAPVDRPKGKNSAAIVAGVIRTPTDRHPDGVTRVLLGDLIEQGLVRIQATITEKTSTDERLELIERTLRGLRNY